MRSALDLLRQNGPNQSKPYLGFSQLKKGHHEIVNFRLVNNKMYNERAENSAKYVILVELKNQILFLPKYFAQHFQDENGADEVEELNRGVKKYLFFDGRRPNK